MSTQILQNVVKFMERVQTSGMEAYAWCEAHAYLTQEIKRLQAPSSLPVVEDKPNV